MMKEALYGKFNKLKNKPIFKNGDIEIRVFVMPDLIYWHILDLTKSSRCEIYELVKNPSILSEEVSWRIVAIPYENSKNAYFKDCKTIKECLECIEKECNMFTPDDLGDIIEADLTGKRITGQFEG